MGAFTQEWAAIAMTASRRPYVDFGSVAPAQMAMHDRLENWARTCRGTPRREGRAGSPLFARYRPGERAGSGQSIDRADAALIAKAVVQLPDKHRRALQWLYLHPGNPPAMARELGVTMEALALLIRDGRQMMLNRTA